VHAYALSRPHELVLRLFEVRCDPDVAGHWPRKRWHLPSLLKQRGGCRRGFRLCLTRGLAGADARSGCDPRPSRPAEAVRCKLHRAAPIYSGRLPAFEYGDRCGRRQFCFARARTALHGWRERLSSIVRDGIEREEIRRSIDANKLATLIISSLEGAMMIGRLEKNSEALLAVQSYLDSYLETEVRSHPRSGILRRL